MKSPKLAAIGVATLSGLIPIRLQPIITPTIIIPGERLREAEMLQDKVFSSLNEHTMEKKLPLF